jgi:hypothetical protein
MNARVLELLVCMMKTLTHVSIRRVLVLSAIQWVPSQKIVGDVKGTGHALQSVGVRLSSWIKIGAGIISFTSRFIVVGS